MFGVHQQVQVRTCPGYDSGETGLHTGEKIVHHLVPSCATACCRTIESSSEGLTGPSLRHSRYVMVRQRYSSYLFVSNPSTNELVWFLPFISYSCHVLRWY